MEMINMNMKNTFKKMVAILGITGISIVSFAMPPKPKNPKQKAMIVQPKRKITNKKTEKKSSYDEFMKEIQTKSKKEDK